MNCHLWLRFHDRNGEWWQQGSGRHADFGFTCKRCGARVVMLTTRDPIGLPAEYYAEQRRMDKVAEQDARIKALEDGLEGRQAAP